VILEDADLSKAVADGIFQCTSTPVRTLAPRSREWCATFEAGRGRESRGDVRGLSRRRIPSPDRACSGTRQRRSTAARRDYINKGIDEGARLITGGTTPPEGLEKGFYVQPTIFSDVRTDMTIAQEKIFGPVLSIFLDTEEEPSPSQ